MEKEGIKEESKREALKAKFSNHCNIRKNLRLHILVFIRKDCKRGKNMINLKRILRNMEIKANNMISILH